MRFGNEIVSSYIALALSVFAPSVAMAITPTTTTLGLSPSGPVAAGTAITLSASVTANGTAVKRGLVLFCNASAAHCFDVAILGQAQLTSSGTAKIKLRLGIGAHNVRAVFQGTTLLAPSPSPATNVTVTGVFKSDIQFSFRDADDLRGQLTAFGPVPTGTISLVDSNHSNALIGSTSVAAAGTTSLQLINGPDNLTSGSPYLIATADFNGDGIPDVAFLDQDANVAVVLLGNGDATFTQKSSTPIGVDPAAIAVGDFNGDGIVDLVTGSFSFGTVGTLNVLLGNGDGTFKATALPTPTIDGPIAITVGDFNGDGTPDLAVLNNGTNFLKDSILVLLGNGDGTFTPKPTIADPRYAQGLVAVDLNGDGLVDLAVTEHSLPFPSPDPPTVTTMLSNGDGSFTTKSQSIIADPLFFPGPIVAGDFNRDGKIDLILGDNATLFGNGDGTFTATATPIQGLSGLGLGDFNGDGIADLVAARQTDDAAFGELYIGNGEGAFTLQSSKLEGFTNGLVVTDFNGDGIADTALGLSPANASTELLVRLGAFLSVADFPSSLAPGTHAVVASYSGDANYAATSSQPFNIVVTGRAPEPVFSPQPGIYGSTQSITFTNPGQFILYTLDGSTPTASSMLYEGPISVAWDATIKAVIDPVSGGLSPSNVVTGTYSIVRPLPSPTFSLPPGTYPAPQMVSLDVYPSYCAHAVCDIFYTTNGQLPTERSTKYTGPIVLNKRGTVEIRALAISHHFKDSYNSATYTLK